MAELQVIPARHGTATYVPAGHTIKIINTSGTQVVDTWAFALPKPEPKKGEQPQKPDGGGQEEKKDGTNQKVSKTAPTKSKKSGIDLPSQEDAEKATQEGVKEGEDNSKDANKTAPQKSTWNSYVPSIGLPSFSKEGAKDGKQETERQKDSRTWASYFPSGQGFSNYIPKTATDTVSSFAASHKRDPNKTYIEQLQEFSKTPVGAAGLAALSGSGYGSSMLAGYNAWNAQNASNVAAMEFLSMPHSRAATLHMRPKVNDTLVSNLREPILTLIEDTSPGIHDTLIAACDPARYQGLGVEKWEEHGSCAENLVLALKELNERAGLKGAKGVGADVTINSVPAPLNLFMNIPWDDNGDIGFYAPKCKKDDYVRFKAERDVVIVMSACPQDILEINNKNPTDAHFLVEEEETKQALKRTQFKKRPPPRKIASSRATSTVGTETGPTPVKRTVPQRRAAPQKRPAPAVANETAKKQQTQPVKSQETQPAKPQQTPPARKKPVPPPVAPPKEAVGGAQGAANNGAVEKKKPRKLTPKPKVDAQGET